LGKTTAYPAPLPTEPTYKFGLGKCHCQKAFASQKTNFAFAVRFASISLRLGFTKSQSQFSQILRLQQPLLPTKPSKAHKRLYPKLATTPASLAQT